MPFPWDMANVRTVCGWELEFSVLVTNPKHNTMQTAVQKIISISSSFSTIFISYSISFASHPGPKLFNGSSITTHHTLSHPLIYTQVFVPHSMDCSPQTSIKVHSLNLAHYLISISYSSNSGLVTLHAVMSC